MDVEIGKQLELAIGQVVQLGEQLITLSTGILVLSITFVKDILKRPASADRSLLAVAWCGYLLTIVAGIWLRMAVAGSLAASKRFVGFEANVTLPAGVQIVLFLFATSAFLVLAIRGIK
jgi:hypothetical protein